ncbi:MAG TPA: hypothetical protein VFE47_30720 [Tepidisphaeraceae bacterium]|jgi:hypothetical protein|nr:hypothetical protein [Tepidisphaeraceae bacterium]
MKWAIAAILLATSISLAHDTGKYKVGRDSDGEQIWKLTDYLHGTRFEIRQQLNGEAARVKVKVAELEQKVAEETKQIQRDQAAGKNDDVTKDKALLRDDQARLSRMRAALAKTEKWRDELIHVLWNTFSLEWPVEIGTTGMLGEIQPTKITGDSFSLIYEADEEISGKALGEGISHAKLIPHTIHLTVTGADTANWKPGTKIRFSHAVEITGKTADAKGTVVYTAKVVDNDASKLLTTISEPAK